jgi:hypothetical protein
MNKGATPNSTFGYFSGRIPIANARKKHLPIFPVAKVEKKLVMNSRDLRLPNLAAY